ncbi:E4 [Canis familiaris papillomavirus 9]|uniref:E4 n=1 Tax=Canis familiaris papillomavirus 9 TaxID=1087108 RepID=G4XF66_9PAPI|nr:E4 [Canis familiaris papillomavirus 9]AEP82738.1 E4 [Canis familiaris papillomavirus 9]QNS42839.1 E4 [Canis familiaris papillomavirus 9]QNS42846.1 E4 [Canis familiaris papillomavirus 9]
MNLFAPPNLLPAQHRPNTLVQKLWDLLTGPNGWPEEVELRELGERGRGRRRSPCACARPPTPQTPPHTPPTRSRRRHRSRYTPPQSDSTDWDDLQALGACSLTPPLGSPLLTPEEVWFPRSQNSPPVLSPCPGASPLPRPSPGPCTPRPRLLDLDQDQRLPHPSPLPLPDSRPSLTQQRKALDKALRQVQKDAFQLEVDIGADLGRFFGKLGIAPRQ